MAHGILIQHNPLTYRCVPCACVGLFVVSILVAIVACVVVETSPPSPGVTAANFDRIENGMILAEVEAIYGRTPDRSEKTDPGVSLHIWKLPRDTTTTVLISQ